jgi:hypothetical protein
MYNVQKATKGLKNFLKELSICSTLRLHVQFVHTVVGTRDWEYTIRNMLYVLNTYITIIKKENWTKKKILPLSQQQPLLECVKGTGQ